MRRFFLILRDVGEGLGMSYNYFSDIFLLLWLGRYHIPPYKFQVTLLNVVTVGPLHVVIALSGISQPSVEYIHTH